MRHHSLDKNIAFFMEAIVRKDPGLVIYVSKKLFILL